MESVLPGGLSGAGLGGLSGAIDLPTTPQAEPMAPPVGEGFGIPQF
jgi:hypothetical protein